MSTFEEAGVRSGEESIGGDHPQNSMGQLARLLGRPKSFAGREDEWHDWSLKFGATAATLSEYANTWMSDAKKKEYGNHSGSTEPGNGEYFCATVVYPAS